MNGAALPADTGFNKRVMISKDLCKQLLPDLPDDLVLNMICPKLSWRDLHSLSSVSPWWRQAIQARKVYDARVHHNSTETLVAIVNCHLESECCSNHDFHTITLYSKRDEARYRLPPIPGLPTGIPYFCQCVSLKSKIYCLGGAKEIGHYCGRAAGRAEVYVLDLAGQRQWKQCASMREPRRNFGIGVMAGKIYVFRGISGLKPVLGSEVYDPQMNAWSDIKPSSFPRYGQHVVAIGEELFVHGGTILHTYSLHERDFDSGLWWAWRLGGEQNCTEVYHPVKDEWRLIPDCGWTLWDDLSVSQGWFHVQKPDLQLSVGLYESFLRVFGLKSFVLIRVSLHTLVAVGGELLAGVDWCDLEQRLQGTAILQSDGFREDWDLSCERSILWKIIGREDAILGYSYTHCPWAYTSSFVCPIEL